MPTTLHLSSKTWLAAALGGENPQAVLRAPSPDVPVIARDSLPPEFAATIDTERRIGAPHAVTAVTGRLGLPEGGEVIELCRLRLSDDEPVMLEYNRFPAAYTFLEKEPIVGSLYDLLRAHGLIPTRATHDISLGHATPAVSRQLATAVGEALLLLDELVYDQQDRPLHTSRQWIRGDKFTFRI